jgi:hypothetical protein
MTDRTRIVDTLARDFGISVENVLDESLRSFLEKKLREVSSQYYAIGRKYGVCSVLEMEQLYVSGKIEESVSREDFETLDHLEFKKNEIEQLIGQIA